VLQVVKRDSDRAKYAQCTYLLGVRACTWALDHGYAGCVALYVLIMMPDGAAVAV
jgi:hypothetical protein